MRLVFGLGTRAVERADDDYTRIVALNAPSRRPETSLEEVTEHAQRRVDVLDLERTRLTAAAPGRGHPGEPGPARCDLFAAAPRPGAGWVLTFEKLLAGTPASWSRSASMLATLEEAYRYPVDVEFTGNFLRRRRAAPERGPVPAAST